MGGVIKFNSQTKCPFVCHLEEYVLPIKRQLYRFFGGIESWSLQCVNTRAYWIHWLQNLKIIIWSHTKADSRLFIYFKQVICIIVSMRIFTIKNYYYRYSYWFEMFTAWVFEIICCVIIFTLSSLETDRCGEVFGPLVCIHPAG